MKVFNKLGEWLLHISQDAEDTSSGQTKLLVSDKPIKKVLEDIHAELVEHSELLDRKEKLEQLLPDLLLKDNRKSQFVVSGFTDTDIVHFDVQNVQTQTAYMLIDLSDITNWPHVNIGHIVIEYIIIEIDPDPTTYLGEIKLGFLENVDATNGDFHQIIDLDMRRKSELLVEVLDFGSHGLDLRTNHWFGPTTANSVLFQTTGADIVGPDGNSFPSGEGDFVMIIEASAGAVDVSLTIGYETVDPSARVNTV